VISATHAIFGFDYKTCCVISSIHEQSPDISMGVDESKEHEQGAGDQGIMFGYACRETEEMMPLPIILAHGLVRRLGEVRRDKTLNYLRPDGKSQVTVEYQGDVPKRVEAVVLAAQHNASVKMQNLRDDLERLVVRKVIPAAMIDKKTKFIINGTGRFEQGGPLADTGMTGRKIIVDTYGGVGSHGGGSFSGKDPSKVDRSGSYTARYIAKNLVASGIADKLEVQLAYAIGVAEPVSIMLDSFDTAKIHEDKIKELIRAHFALKPKAMTSALNLLRPIYRQTAVFGHFGRKESDFTWERTDRPTPCAATPGCAEEKMEHDIKDLGLAKGRLKIEWAAWFMPVLQSIKKKFAKEKPLPVSASPPPARDHRDRNLMEALRPAGPTWLSVLNPLSTQDDAAAAMVKYFGVPVFAIKGKITNLLPARQ
jgi:S-adenosylmethionine synthetase